MGDLEPGTRVAGYTVERLVGRGGFGAVYVALDRKLGRRVALKVLDEGRLEDQRSRSRFVDESRQAASLDHPNIVPIFEAGTSGGRPWLAMRYVPGPDLAGSIARDGRLPADRVARIVTQVAAALDAAHGAGLVHRDVKPGNVLLAAGTDGLDHAYLTDFGLSKRVGGTGAVTATTTGRFVGTVGYVAPEQIKGRTIDARADIYSLGCLAFHALTGGAPFARDSEIDTLMAHVDAPVPSVHDALPDLADRVDPVLARAMAKEPSARHATAGAFAAELATALGSRERLAPVTRGFLFSDLRGYTAFIEANGDAAAVALLDRYRRLVREVLARQGGAEIKTEGDSFYAVFPSASAAVEAGLGIVAAAASATAQRPDLPVTVGVGIHAGESAETAEGYVGSSVNIAARTCAQAGAGEVLITDTVRSLVRTSLVAELVPKGRRQLKGITEPVALYAVRPPIQPAAPPEAGRSGRRPGTRALVPVGGRSGPTRWLLAATGAVVVALVAVGGLLIAGAFPGMGPGSSPTGGPRVAGVERILFSREVDEIDAGCEIGNAGNESSRPFAVGRNGAELRELPIDGDLWVSAPAIAPDGGTIAFWGNPFRSAGLFQWEPASGEPRQVTGFGPFPDSSVRQVRWSPDGSRVAWVDPLGMDGAMGWETEGTLSVMTVADGSMRTAFAAATPSAEAASPGPSAPPPDDGRDSVDLQGTSDRIRAVDWLPDGTLVVAAGPDLWALDRDLVPRRRLGSLPDHEIVAMAVAPSGDRVVVAAGVSVTDGRPGPADLHVIPLDGTEPLRLTDDPGVDTQPAWSPDGSEIAFTSDRAGRHTIYAITADGSAIRSITRPAPGYHDCWPAWGVVESAAAPAFLPTPSPGQGQAPPPLEFRRGTLEPGTYRTTDFQPPFQVTTSTPWKVFYNVADAIRADHRPSDDVRHELQVLRLTAAYDPACHGPDEWTTTLLGSDPQAVIEWLRSRPELETGSPIPRVIGGRSVLEMGFAMRDGLTSTELCGTEQFPNGLTLFPSGGDLVVLRDGQAGRVWVFDVDGATVTVMASGTATAFPEALAEIFEPLVYSLGFEAAGGSTPARTDGGSASPAPSPSGPGPGSTASPSVDPEPA